jgi:8-oxo-dGTP diphosphatase
MTVHSARPYVAAFVIFRKNGQVAFLKRQNTNWMNGRYGLPAGKVEPEESPAQAAIREAKEEVGVSIKLADLRHLTTVYRTNYADNDTNNQASVWLDVIFEAQSWEGELHNAEPEKHSEFVWLDPDNLPGNVTPYLTFFFEQIKAGNRYAEAGW